MYWVFHAIPREPYLFQLKENNMSSTHKISALRSLATKVALGLGIALVASSIAPMAVAPASADAGDYVDFLTTGGIGRFTENTQSGNLASTSVMNNTFAGAAPATKAIKVNTLQAGDMWYAISADATKVYKYLGGSRTEIFPASLVGVNNTVATALYSDGTYIYFAVLDMNGQTPVSKIYRYGLNGGPDPVVVISGITDGLSGIEAMTVVNNKLYYSYMWNNGGTDTLAIRSTAFTGLPYAWTNAGASAKVDIGTADNLDDNGNHQLFVDGSLIYIPRGYSLNNSSIGGLKTIDTANNDALGDGTGVTAVVKPSYMSILNGVTYLSGLDGAGHAIVARNAVGSSPAWSAYLPSVTAVWAVQGPRVFVSYSPNRQGGTGSGTMNSSSVTPGGQFTLPANQFTNTGLTFRGWATSGMSSTVVYSDQASISSVPINGLSLYAVWAFELTYDSNGGSGTTPSTQYVTPSGGQGNATLVTPTGLTKNGSNIVGWDTSASTTCPSYTAGNLSVVLSASRTYYAIYTNSGCLNSNQNQNQQNQQQNQVPPPPPSSGPHTVTFVPNGGLGSPVTVTGTNITVPAGPSHATNGCTFLGWGMTSTVASPDGPTVGRSYPFAMDYTFYAVWSSASCRTAQQQQQQQQQNNAPAQPAPELDLSGLKTIPAPTAGVTGGVAGIDLKGKNLPVVSSVTVSGKDGKVVTSTDSALKLDLPTLAPGSYDIVMKTAGGGSITIQNGLVIAPPVDNTPVKPVVIAPSVPRTTLVAATAPVPGFIPGKATVSDAQKAIIQDVVLTKNVTALECVGVSNAKVSAKLAAARAAAICAAAKQQNPALTTSVRTTTEAKVNGPVGSVLINYSH